MTIIINVTSGEYTVSLSDRRIVWVFPHTAVDDDSAKGMSVRLDDARVAVAYTGLAAVGGFRLFPWLVQKIVECAPPDHTLLGLQERLAEKLTDLFTTNMHIRFARPDTRCTTVSFAGYVHDTAGGSRAVNAIVSNFETGVGGSATNAPRADFTPHGRISNPGAPHGGIVGVFGWARGVAPASVQALADLSETNPALETLIAKVTRIHREAADHPASRGMIGLDASVVVLQRDSSRPTLGMRIEERPATDPSTLNLSGPCFIDATSSGRGTPIITGLTITPPPGSRVTEVGAEARCRRQAKRSQRRNS